MTNIDYIMELLDWNNSVEKQAQGVKLARDVKCISAFLQPGFPYGKNIWDNCAIILSDRTDEELSFYLIDLMEWLQDMNWPGAFCILDRLQRYKDNTSFNFAFSTSMKHAQALKDESWEENLQMLKQNRT